MYVENMFDKKYVDERYNMSVLSVIDDFRITCL